MNKAFDHELLAYAIKESVNLAERRMRFVISTDEIDRHREIVLPEAVEKSIPAFGNNPVCLSQHSHYSSDGRSTVIGHWDTDSFKRSAHRCEMDLIFAPTDLGEDYWKLYSGGHQRAVSIGFIMKGFQDSEDKKTGRVRTITELELIEISCVAVGANRGALAKEAEWENDQIKALAGQVQDLTELVKSLHEQIELLATNGDDLAEGFLLGEKTSEPDRTAGLVDDNAGIEQVCDLLMAAIAKLKQ